MSTNPATPLKKWVSEIEEQINARAAEIEKTERLPGTNHTARILGDCSAEIKVCLSPEGACGTRQTYSFTYPWLPK